MVFKVPNYIMSEIDINKPIITRFPPEPSGYLHIGHARALFINFFISKILSKHPDSKFIVRMDNTNPKVEDQEYEDAILHDIKNLLKIDYDLLTHSSDYFPFIYQLCQHLLDNNLVFVDASTHKDLKVERSEFKPSPYRDIKVTNNINQIPKDSCLRIKLDYTSKNGSLRDPVILRWNDDKLYPTYDFICPIVDYIEGVTHVFRDINYQDRDEQYLSILEKSKDFMDMTICSDKRKEIPKLFSFGRINFNDTNLSKRHMKKSIMEGMYDGWDDIRLGSLRSLFKQGLCLEGLKEFIYGEGIGKTIVKSTWNKFWSINGKIINNNATRYLAIDSKKAFLCQIKHDIIDKSIFKFEKNKSLGERILYSPNTIVLLQLDDYDPNDKLVTLINLATFDFNENLLTENTMKSFKDTKPGNKLLWVDGQYCNLYITSIDVNKKIITNLFYGEKSMNLLKPGDYVQLIKNGYYIVNRINDNNIDLIQIP